MHQIIVHQIGTILIYAISGLLISYILAVLTSKKQAK